MIRFAFDNDLHDTLHYWVRLKFHFKKPTYYNFTYKYIGSILGCSPSTALRHIKKMLEHGWCRVHKGNLCMAGTNSLERSLQTFLVKVRIFKKKKDQLASLRSAIIIRHCNFQKKEVKKKTEIVRLAKTVHGKLTRKAIVKIRSFGGLTEFEKSIRPRITLSNQKIGEIFGKSKVSGRRYQRLMNAVGVIKSSPHFVKTDVRCCDYDLLKRFGLFRTSLGDIYLQSSNTISWECNSTRS